MHSYKLQETQTLDGAILGNACFQTCISRDNRNVRMMALLTGENCWDDWRLNYFLGLLVPQNASPSSYSPPPAEMVLECGWEKNN